MRINKYQNIAFTLMIATLAGCAGSKYGSKKNEHVAMHCLPKNDVIYTALAKLEKQDKPELLAVRTRGARGLLGAYEGGVISLGVSAVKDFINNSQKKYTDTWSQGLNDLYFYDQPSSDGPFDPVGLQFSGFSLTRTVKINNTDCTAVKADFELNTDSIACKQIINDGIFKLKLKDIQMNYSKAKVRAGQEYINVDFEITFTTSYISKEGQFFSEVPLGKFYYSLRHAPLDSVKDAKAYHDYYDKLKNTPVAGKCFLVPRSYGYYKTGTSALTPYYNQGNFSIAVKVTESSKNSFVNQMIINTSGIGIDYGTNALMQQMKITAPVKK